MTRRATPAGLLLALLAGCASWEATRDQLVLPINALVHQRYPRALVAGDDDALRAMHTAESVTDPLALLARFARVDQASCIIDDSLPPEDGQVRLTCRLLVHGVDAAQAPLSLERDVTLVVAQVDGAWRIVAREVEAEREVRRRTPRFSEQAAARGIDFVPRSRGTVNRVGEPQLVYLGSGAAPADLDGDGLEELLLIGGDQLTLLHNDGGTFRDVTAAWGLTAPTTGDCRCAAWADVDNDGDLDLFVGMLYADDVLYRNDGGRFTALPPERSGLRPTEHTTGATFVDVDRDGWVDLYVASSVDLNLRYPEPIIAADNAEPNRLYRNRGDGTFEDVTEQAGVGDTGWSWACMSLDLDLDGWPDLFVSNDFGPDVLYRNRGDGTFADVSADAGLVLRGSSMSADTGDANGDGYPDIVVSGMNSNSRWITRQPGFPAPAPAPIAWLFREHVLDVVREMFHGNRLYLNQGDGTFVDSSEASGIRASGWGWGAVFADVDNDGREDVYSVNGFLTGADPDDL